VGLQKIIEGVAGGWGVAYCEKSIVAWVNCRVSSKGYTYEVIHYFCVDATVRRSNLHFSQPGDNNVF